jgi:hypothetical protein
MRAGLPNGRHAAMMAHAKPVNRRPKTEFTRYEPIKPLPWPNRTR